MGVHLKNISRLREAEFVEQWLVRQMLRTPTEAQLKAFADMMQSGGITASDFQNPVDKGHAYTSGLFKIHLLPEGGLAEGGYAIGQSSGTDRLVVLAKKGGVEVEVATILPSIAEVFGEINALYYVFPYHLLEPS
jgi:hypothetical protein